MFSGLLHDIRYGLRQLARQPLFTILAAVLLALGIGANTAIFSIVDSVLLRPLPYPETDRLFFVRVRDMSGGDPVLPNMLEYLALEKGIGSAEAVGALLWQPFNLKWKGQSIAVTGGFASPGFFPALGLKLLAGRPFHPEEFQSGRNQAAYFMQRFWMDRMGGDRGLLGKTVEMEKETHVIAGILPSLPGEIQLPEAVVPLPVTREMVEAYERRSMVVAVRLKRGATKHQADEEIRAIYRRLGEETPQSSRNREGYLVPAAEFWRGKAHQPLMVLSLAVALVLLLACANLAGLLLARASSRLKEVAIRAALGASQVQVFRQMITESVLLAILGGAVGMAGAALALGELKAWPGLRLPRIEQAEMNWHALVFALGVSVAAGILFGLAPALSVLRVDLAAALSEESRGASAGRGRRWLRAALVGLEVGLCTILLVASGLLWRTYQRLSTADMGFRPDNVLLLRTMLPQVAYPDDAAREAFHRQALERLRALQGVMQASMAAYPPLSNVNWPCMFRIPGHATAGELQLVAYNTVSPGYFSTIGAELRAGRDFSESDTRESPKVLIISETFREQFFPNEDPLGREIEYVLMGEQSRGTIIGVVRDIAFDRPDNARRAMIYESFLQRPWPFPMFAVKTAGPPQQMVPAVTKALADLAPDVAADQVSELRTRVNRSTGQHSAALKMFGLFSGVAVVLSAVGLYGVLALSVAQRRREIGVRMALGATPERIRAMVLRYGFTLAGIGMLCGMAVSPLAGWMLERMVYGVRAFDPAVYGAVALLLGAISAGAAAVPALRAARLEPAAALRE
ncbi:MAG: ABC transporter permease [Bryobacteraceae bacterium]